MNDDTKAKIFFYSVLLGLIPISFFVTCIIFMIGWVDGYFWALLGEPVFWVCDVVTYVFLFVFAFLGYTKI